MLAIDWSPQNLRSLYNVQLNMQFEQLISEYIAIPFPLGLLPTRNVLYTQSQVWFQLFFTLKTPQPQTNPRVLTVFTAWF